MYWKDTPTIIRWTCLILIPLGIAAGVIGWYGDGHCWWDNRSFQANLLSSATGFFIGAPLALAVLSHLSNAQAEAIERRTARRQSASALANFRELAVEAFSVPERNQAQAAVNDLLSLAIEMQRLAIALRDSYQPTSRIDNEGQLAAALNEFHDRCKQTFDLGASMQAGASWVGRVSAQWRTIDSDIRPRIDASGLPWIAPSTSFKIAKSVEVVGAGPRSWFAGQQKAFVALTRDGSFPNPAQERSARQDASIRLADSPVGAVRWLGQLWELLDSLDDITAIESQYRS